LRQERHELAHYLMLRVRTSMEGVVAPGELEVLASRAMTPRTLAGMR
jgi:hypothetical protein